jgi:hypothetical protein
MPKIPHTSLQASVNSELAHTIHPSKTLFEGGQGICTARPTSLYFLWLLNVELAMVSAGLSMISSLNRHCHHISVV